MSCATACKVVLRRKPLFVFDLMIGGLMSAFREIEIGDVRGRAFGVRTDLRLKLCRAVGKARATQVQQGTLQWILLDGHD